MTAIDRPLRLALAQIDTTVGDIDGNAAKIRDYLGRRGRGARAARHLPRAGDQRLSARGPAAEDALPGRPGGARSTTSRATCRDMVALVGFAEHAEDVYNSLAVLADGRCRAIYRKMFLPNYGVFDEQRYFQVGDARGRDRRGRHDDRPDGLRGHLGAGPARERRGAGRRRGDREHLRLAVPPRTRAPSGSGCSCSAPGTASPTWRSATWSAGRTSSCSTATAWSSTRTAS